MSDGCLELEVVVFDGWPVGVLDESHVVQIGLVRNHGSTNVLQVLRLEKCYMRGVRMAREGVFVLFIS